LPVSPYGAAAPTTCGKTIYDAAGPPRKIVWWATTGFSFASGGSGPPVLGFGSKRGELLLEISTRI
jgi:hypothetical protein